MPTLLEFPDNNPPGKKRVTKHNDELLKAFQEESKEEDPDGWCLEDEPDEFQFLWLEKIKIKTMSFIP